VGLEPLSFVSIEQLVQLPKRLRQLAGDRAQELSLLRDEFADPDELARIYVEPHLQDRCPAETGRDVPLPVPRQPAFSLLNRFFDGGPPRLKDGSHLLFLLADAGLGKTSLLLAVKLTHLAGFWPPGCRCELLRLDKDSLAKIAALDGRSDTVLLLDGLNEDPMARNRVQERLLELAHACQDFRRVIIACRTFFFPDIISGRCGQPLIKGLAGRNCAVLHLSPFDRHQMQELIAKRLGRGGYLGFGGGRQRQQAAQLLEQLQHLGMQPLLLQHIENLLELDVRQNWNPFTLCEALLKHWLGCKLQILKELHGSCQRLPERNEMFGACIRAAFWMEEHDRWEIAEKDLWELLCEDANVCWLERFAPDQCSLLIRTSERGFRFSHPVFREFLLACGLLSDRRALPFSVRATDQIIRFLELNGGVGSHLSRIDGSGFDPLRHAELHGRVFLWRDRLNRTQLGPEMIVLPRGRFRMGDLSGGTDNAMPAHEVELDSFALGRFPVTFAEYDEFCGITGRNTPKDGGWGRDRRPVVNVSWQDAADYCEWLSQETGRHYRLPTEAEWECACRAGSESMYCFGDDEEQLGLYGWYVRNAGRMTQPVGAKQANAWGFCDMHGNVWEWCADWYAEDAYSTLPVRNPAGAEHGAGRVLRGGSWDSSGRFVNSFFRFCLAPGLRIIRAGFRVALGA
jgi:formylglycine-generating enzyme required for sulfatase activity